MGEIGFSWTQVPGSACHSNNGQCWLSLCSPYCISILKAPSKELWWRLHLSLWRQKSFVPIYPYSSTPKGCGYVLSNLPVPQVRFLTCKIEVVVDNVCWTNTESSVLSSLPTTLEILSNLLLTRVWEKGMSISPKLIQVDTTNKCLELGQEPRSVWFRAFCFPTSTQDTSRFAVDWPTWRWIYV